MNDLVAVLARLDKITPGEWRPARQGYIFGPDCQIANVGDYRDKELLPFNKERWDSDARAIALVPELIAVAKAAAELRKMPRTGDASVEKMTANLDAALSALAQRGEGMKPTKIPVKAPKPVKEIKPIRAWALADGKRLTCCVHWTRALLMREYEGTSLKPVRVEIRVLGGKK